MPGEQRKCANCRFFQDAGMANNGWCTHPKRQMNSDVKLLVRAGELACRNPWGGDLFESRNDAQQSQPDHNEDSPAGQQPVADDEVTSVVTPPDRFSTPRTSDEDRVVSDRPAPIRDRDDDDTYNDAARLDQDERARIMARGSRDALQRARERHSYRWGNSDAAGNNQNDLPATNDRVVAHQARFSDRYAGSGQQGRSGADDAPVPRSEVRKRFTTPAERFDTVPEIDPSFDLPGFRNSSFEPAMLEPEEPETHAEPAPAIEDEDPPRAEHQHEPYEHVLERARRIRQSKLQKAANPLRHSQLLARHQSRTHGHTDDADAAEAAPAPRQDEPPHEPDDAPLPYQDEDPMYWDDYLGDGEDVDDDIDREPPDITADSEYLDDDMVDPVESFEDVPAERTGRRPGGWLSHFGIRRREAITHDDALVTRHTGDSETSNDWIDQDLEFPRRWNDDDDVPDAPIENERPEPAAAELDDVDHYEEDGFEGDPLDDVAYDYTDETSDVAASSLPDLYDEPDPDVEPSRPPVAPRSRTEPWHRQRATHHDLPDLDDNLFEETFERPRPSSLADALDRAPVPGPVPAEREEMPAAQPEPGTVWPRESYFRSSRYRVQDSEPASARHAADEAHAALVETPQRLPDLDAGFDLRELVSRGGELLDMTIDIAPDVPRECRTCRSFRSADGGARGWCTNEWAFTHRRMVNEDDLACETTIGCWWLPADRYWLIEEIDGYAVATPRMDRLIAQREHPSEQRISGA